MTSNLKRRGWEARFWAKVALPDESGCMLWLAGKARKGYGKFKLDGKYHGAHRVSLHLAAGPPLDEERTHVAHSCRSTGCVAPAHLRWATPAENAADKRRDGTELLGERNHQARLTADQVAEIRKAYACGGVTQRQLAAVHAVTQKTIWLVVAGERWKHVQEVAS